MISSIFWENLLKHLLRTFFLPRSFQNVLPFAFLPSGSFRPRLVPTNESTNTGYTYVAKKLGALQHRRGKHGNLEIGQKYVKNSQHIWLSLFLVYFELRPKFFWPRFLLNPSWGHGHGRPRLQVMDVRTEMLVFLGSRGFDRSFCARTSAEISAWTPAGYLAPKLTLWAACSLLIMQMHAMQSEVCLYTVARADGGQITHLLCVRLKIIPYDFFRGFHFPPLFFFSCTTVMTYVFAQGMSKTLVGPQLGA